MEKPKANLEELLNSKELRELREAWASMQERLEAEDQAWWDSLSLDERSRAFRQIMKLMYIAEVRDRGSYRYAIYDIFDVDYCDGLDHYMDLHNFICQALSVEE